jgi:Protein of unknown function (DUF3365)
MGRRKRNSPLRLIGHFLVILCCVALSPACTPKPERPDAADIGAARLAALTFDQRMASQITTRLDRDEDPVAVYLSYADNVPGWGKDLSDQGRIDFSRTALGVRNPANAPDAWERQQMEQISFMLDAGLDPETLEIAEIVTEGDRQVFRWMRPVLMTDTCLACHGEAIPARVKLLLGQEYPLDEATGYSAGQLGGAYSVRKVLSIAGKPPPYQPQPAAPRLPPDPRQPGDAPLVTPLPAPAEN